MSRTLMAGLVALVLVGAGCWNARYFWFPETSISYAKVLEMSDEELKRVGTPHLCNAVFMQYTEASREPVFRRRFQVERFFKLYHEFEERTDQSHCIPAHPSESVIQLHADVARHVAEDELWAELNVERADPSRTAARYDQDFEVCRLEAAAEQLSSDWNEEMRDCMRERGHAIR